MIRAVFPCNVSYYFCCYYCENNKCTNLLKFQIKKYKFELLNGYKAVKELSDYFEDKPIHDVINEEKILKKRKAILIDVIHKKHQEKIEDNPHPVYKEELTEDGDLEAQLVDEEFSEYDAVNFSYGFMDDYVTSIPYS